MKQGTQNVMRHVNAKVDQIQVFVNINQNWKDDKCRCECKELIDKGVCGKGFIWNFSNCERESDKSCNVGEYLDYENRKCRQKNSMINQLENVQKMLEK